jgi:hypothetical protein
MFVGGGRPQGSKDWIVITQAMLTWMRELWIEGETASKD